LFAITQLSRVGRVFCVVAARADLRFDYTRGLRRNRPRQGARREPRVALWRG
jgi:hypothetical protein